MQDFEALKAMIAEIEGDVAKAVAGNKAAGTRVRKQMQEVKKLAQDIRAKILEIRE